MIDLYDQKKDINSNNIIWNICIYARFIFCCVPLYDLFCRVTGFGGTTQISKEAPKIVLDDTINVRLDTNVNSQLDWKFESEANTIKGTWQSL